MSDFNYIEECLTTMDSIVPYLEKQNNTPLALYTFNQTAGRGQYGNQWKMPKDENLAFSFAVPTRLISTLPTFFNYHTAVLIKDYLTEITDTKAEIKWPNDTIVAGKKVSGFIIDRQKINGIDYYIIGIGINVNQKDYSHLPKAGSLLTATGKNYDLHQVAKGLFDQLKHHLIVPISNEELLALYNKNLFRKDQISVFQKKGIRQNGIIRHVDEDGYLWIDLEHDGLQKFFHKEIEMFY